MNGDLRVAYRASAEGERDLVFLGGQRVTRQRLRDATMATVEAYQNRRGARLYRVRWRGPDKRDTQKRGFATKREAQAFKATVEVSKLRGEYIRPTHGRITVGELAIHWLERKQQATAPSHYRMLESAWRVHVQPRWGSVCAVDVDALGVEAWVAAMGRKGSGATTVLRAHGVLSGVLSDAVKGKRLAANPANGIGNLPRKTARRHVYLSAEDVHRLAEESGEHRALVLVLAYCGIRWGEAIGLRVRDVQFLRRRLTVHENAVQLGVKRAVGPRRVARRARCRCRSSSWMCWHRSARLRPSMTSCSSAATAAISPGPKSSGGWFRAAVTRAGVQQVSPHDLRHTCASLAVSAGVNVLALARMLGHKDPSVTLRVYADLFDSDLDAHDTARPLFGAECGQNVAKRRF
jgi:integrase